MFVPPVEVTDTFNQSALWVEYAANQHFVLQQNKSPGSTSSLIMDGLASTMRSFMDTLTLRSPDHTDLSSNFPRVSPPVSPAPLRRTRKTVVDFKFRIVLKLSFRHEDYVVGTTFILIAVTDIELSRMGCVISTWIGNGSNSICFGAFS
jgi:hypothetical protein